MRKGYSSAYEKNCVLCGAPFMVGGKNGSHKYRRFCSPACRNKGGGHRAGQLSHTLSSEDAAYFAGLVDGEGTIIFELRNRRDNPKVGLRVVVGLTVPGPLHRLKRATGVGFIDRMVPSNPKAKICYRWSVGADAAATFLSQIRDHMITKREQADLAISLRARMKDPKLAADMDWQMAYRARMRSMNKRGRGWVQNWQAMVREFHLAMGLPAPEYPVPLSAVNWALRCKLIMEEAKEVHEAVEQSDPAAIADGLADLVYVTLGAAVEMGIELQPFYDAVHCANLLKTGGPLSSEGKLLKPPGWEHPDLSKVFETFYGEPMSAVYG